MSTDGITDEFVQQIAEDLRSRYDLDDEDMRTLGSRLAESAVARTAENLEFAAYLLRADRRSHAFSAYGLMPTPVAAGR